MSSHRVAHPVAHATHLASRVPAPRHPAAPWSRRLPVGRVCGCAVAGWLRRSAVGAGPGRARRRAHRRPLLVDGRGGRHHLARRRRPRHLRHACPARSAQPAARQAPDHRRWRCPADRGAGRAAGLRAGPDAGTPGAGAGGQPADRRLRRAVVVAGALSHVRRQRRGRRTRQRDPPARRRSAWSFTWRAPTSSTPSGFRPSAARST